jgi:HSP20 family protein
VVSIRARRQVLRSDGDEVIVDERPQGEFTRQLFLGDNLESGKMQANFDRGVLTLTIPVAEKSKARRIQIGSSGGQSRVIEADSEGTRDQDRRPQRAHA